MPQLHKPQTTTKTDEVLVTTHDEEVDEDACPHKKKQKITELDPVTGDPIYSRVECARCGKWFSATIY
jgi:hypothetical protein